MHFFHTHNESKHDHLKPDALDKIAYDDSHTPLKPDTIDTPIYEKPNAHGDTVLANDKEDLQSTHQEDEMDDEEPIHTTIVRYKTWKRKMAPPPPPSNWSSASLPTDGHSPETEIETRPWTSGSLNQQDIQSNGTLTTYASSSSSSSSTETTSRTLFFHRRRRMGDDTIKYDLHKPSLSQPQHHDIYHNKHLVFRKRQTHSYSWGFCNLLYRLVEKDQGIQVAEARRRAFQKDMTVEWGDDDSRHHHHLTNTNHTRLLFIYRTRFGTDYSIRWKRPSLASHDMVCDLRHREGTWHRLAEFDSHLMGYLVNVGQLEIDKQVLAWVDRPDQLEAHLLVTCSTLVDLMREVVQKAVGLSHGGVA